MSGGRSMFDRMGEFLSDFLETGEMPAASGEGAVRNAGPSVPGSLKNRVPLPLIADFERLGFSRDGTLPNKDECRSAYKERLKTIHPDYTHTNPLHEQAATEETVLLVESWKRLEQWYAAEGFRGIRP